MGMKKRKPAKAKKTILIYGVTGLPLLALFSEAEKAGILCRAVTDVQTGRTVGELLSGRPLPPLQPCRLAGRFALLDGFGGREDEAVDLINRNVSGVIKAMHTPNNDSWTFFRLCTAIREEREQMSR